MKNESPYLLEWIEFHKIVGVERFYLYDNSSEDDSLEILKSYMLTDEVILHDWAQRYAQLAAYQHCLDNYREESEWFAFIDIDEFLFSPIADDLKDILQDFIAYPAVVANWLMFGSSGHQQKPIGLTIENFTKRGLDNFEQHSWIKTIVRPAQTIKPINPHYFVYSDGNFAVTENKELSLEHKTDRNSTHILRINHYFTRSWQEYQAKVERGRADEPIKRDLSQFTVNDRNEVVDLTIHKFLPKLKQNLESIQALELTQLQKIQIDLKRSYDRLQKIKLDLEL